MTVITFLVRQNLALFSKTEDRSMETCHCKKLIGI